MELAEAAANRYPRRAYERYPGRVCAWNAQAEESSAVRKTMAGARAQMGSTDPLRRNCISFPNAKSPLRQGRAVVLVQGFVEKLQLYRNISLEGLVGPRTVKGAKGPLNS